MFPRSCLRIPKTSLPRSFERRVIALSKKRQARSAPTTQHLGTRARALSLSLKKQKQKYAGVGQVAERDEPETLYVCISFCVQDSLLNFVSGRFERLSWVFGLFQKSRNDAVLVLLNLWQRWPQTSLHTFEKRPDETRARRARPSRPAEPRARSRTRSTARVCASSPARAFYPNNAL